MKNRAILVVILLGTISGVAESKQNGQLVYHDEYSYKKVGFLIKGMLEFSRVAFNAGHALAAKMNCEDAFIKNFPRAYVDLMRPEHVKKLLDKYPGMSDKFFHKPAHEVSREDLLKIHSEKYLELLFNDPRVIASIVEMDLLASLPTYTKEFFREAALRPYLLATQGTLDAVDIAMEKRDDTGFGWAINLAGGYHHAKVGGRDNDDYSTWGNCALSDEGLATLKALEKYKKDIKRVMLIDLDAHQGNGNADVLGDNKSVAIFDMYNAEASGNYPPDQKEMAKKIAYNVALKRWTNGDQYLTTLKEQLPKAVDEFKPDFIIYNAGTDPLKGDPEGMLCVSRKQMIERDEIVFMLAKERGIPIVMAPSGGYTEESAGLIADSIINLFDKGIIEGA